ncbi:MAG: hypothetical protein FWB91_00435 [Defluviitaleaceae bacterium]|nr:hypothetical protein [Defluviitaleaceae bacterium]
MAYETKVILTALAERIALAETVREAYGAVQRAANVEGANLPPFDDFKKELMKEKENK